MLTPEVREQVRAAVRGSPAAMTMQLARRLGVPEVEVVREMPDGRSRELDATRAEELLQRFEELGHVHVIVSNDGVTCETQGTFGGFSRWGEFFNVQTETLDMHIRPARLATIFAVVKPSHTDAVPTLSFQFFDPAGNAVFKVFLTFGQAAPSEECQARFEALIAEFRKP
jgi:putative heme iron utilization protein